MLVEIISQENKTYPFVLYVDGKQIEEYSNIDHIFYDFNKVYMKNLYGINCTVLYDNKSNFKLTYRID